jgi:hypothetical protein
MAEPLKIFSIIAAFSADDPADDADCSSVSL